VTIDEALTAYLKANAAVSALVGDRIEPDVLSHGSALPAITYATTASPRPTIAHDGAGTVGAQGVRATLSLTAWGLTRASASAVAAALRRALVGYSGLMGDVAGVGGLRVSVPECPGAMTLYDGEPGRYREVTDFVLLYCE
jgi:hypothetical protein